jgi:hypothetical protein
MLDTRLEAHWSPRRHRAHRSSTQWKMQALWICCAARDHRITPCSRRNSPGGLGPRVQEHA